MFLKRIQLISPIDKLTQLDIEITKPLLCLVGDNGIGKSTILDALREDLKIADQSFFKRNGLKKHFEFTWDNPPSNPHAYDTHAEDKKFAGAFGNDISAQVSAMKMSSGEASILFLSRIFKKQPDFLIVDEIDRGLSIKNQLIIAIGILNKIYSKNIQQVILSCHSQSMVEMWQTGFNDYFQLFDVESNKTLTWDEYHSSQLDKAMSFFQKK